MNNLSPHSDELFNSWVTPLLERAAAYAYSIVRSREDAQDAVQDALLKAYRNLHQYDRSLSFKAWWFAIVRNCCLDMLRKRQVRVAAASMELTGLPSVRQEGPDKLARKDTLNWALGQLSTMHREVIELRYFGDCSYAEIAKVLSIPEGTVMSRLHGARKALADLCRKEFT